MQIANTLLNVETTAL